MRRDRFESITRCLYLVDPTKFMSDKSNSAYNKLAKALWLVNEIRSRCNSLWNCSKFVIVDEMMILYESK